MVEDRKVYLRPLEVKSRVDRSFCAMAFGMLVFMRLQYGPISNAECLRTGSGGCGMVLRGSGLSAWGFGSGFYIIDIIGRGGYFKRVLKKVDKRRCVVIPCVRRVCWGF